MHASIIALFAAAGASLVSATPLKRQTCSQYPWFLAPSPDTTDCTNPAAYQPTSGPETSSPNAQTCQPLYQPGAAPASFLSVGVNPDACPDQTYTVLLYTTGDCSDQPTTVTTASCVIAPSSGNFTAFSTELFLAN